MFTNESSARIQVMARAREVYIDALRTQIRALEVANRCAKQRARLSPRPPSSVGWVQSEPRPVEPSVPSVPNTLLDHGLLTRRQREVAMLIARGCTNQQIAETLVLTPGTVANHVGAILSRLGVANRTQIAAWMVDVTRTRQASTPVSIEPT
jgi:DNA-binding NarL/FixJ family response regulator